MFSPEEQEIENEVNTSLVKAKSSFHSPGNRNIFLDKTIDFLQQQNFKLLAKISQILPKLSGIN